jgi:hypothetical protein
MGGQRHAPAALPLERPGTHCIGGWVGPRAALNGCRKSRSPPGFDPLTAQPGASRYTDSCRGPQEEKYNASLFENYCDVMADTVMYIYCCFEMSLVGCEPFSKRISKRSKRSIS